MIKQGGHFLEFSGSSVINVEPNLEGGHRAVVALQVIHDKPQEIRGPITIEGFTGVIAQANFKRNDRVFSYQIIGDLPAFKRYEHVGGIPTDAALRKGLKLDFQNDDGDVDTFHVVFDMTNAGQPGKPGGGPVEGIGTSTGPTLEEIENKPWAEVIGNYSAASKADGRELGSNTIEGWKQLRDRWPDSKTPAEARKMQDAGTQNVGGGR